MNAYLKQYAEAVNALLGDGAELKTVLKNLQAALRARGHEKLYAAILRFVARTYPAAAAAGRPLLVVAKESDAAVYTAALKLKEADIKIDPSIVGGYVLMEHDQRRDHSYKSKLLTWYRQTLADD